MGGTGGEHPEAVLGPSHVGHQPLQSRAHGGVHPRHQAQHATDRGVDEVEVL